MAEAVAKRKYAWWSLEETETLIELAKQGKSTVEIAKAVGRSRKMVYNKMWAVRREGAFDDRDNSRIWDASADMALMSMLKDGLPIDRVCRLTRRPERFIKDRMEALVGILDTQNGRMP